MLRINLEKACKLFSLPLILVVVLLLYSQHFNNPLHFDDAHTIEENPAIRSLSNIPEFFRDGTLFSILKSNQSYRPLLSATLTLDYWLSGGLDPSKSSWAACVLLRAAALRRDR